MKTTFFKRICIAACCLLLTAAWGMAQNITVTGNVKDASGEPVMGAGVMVAGTTQGTVTDFDGNYSISVPATASLVFSSIGFTDQTIPVEGRSVIDVILAEDNELLDEVVVVGYGVQKKRLVTGSTIKVEGDLIQKQNTTDAIGALYSSVPGVNITQSNGQPWSGYKITVRGLNTTGDSTPLYVIDGIAGGSISSLNPADIESIDILKDAASAAIYGARAAAGVVLVTTKQGKKGHVNVTYDTYYSFQRPNFNGVHPVDGSEYIRLIDEDTRSKGIDVPDGQHYQNYQEIMPVQWQWMKEGKWNGTDWLTESVNKKSHAYNHALSVTGGNDLVRYAFGFTKSYTEGVLGYPKRTYYDRNTIRLNTEISLWRKDNRDILKAGENATLSIYSSNGMSTGDIYGSDVHTALVHTPLLPAYDLDGSLYTFEKQTRDGWSQTRGAGNLLEKYGLGRSEGKTYRLQSNVYLEFMPHQDWKFRSVFGYGLHTSHSRSYTPAYTLSSMDTQSTDQVSQSGSLSTYWTLENTVSWSHDFEKHHVDALIGHSLEKTGIGMSVNASQRDTKFGTWEAANIDSAQGDINARNVSVGGSNTVPYFDLVSMFARANYNYDERYMATFIVRRDGSSNFASGHRFGIFPSVSAGWNISNEPWMENSRGWLNHLKLRGSWGQNGNASIAPFQYLATVSLDAGYDVSANGMSVSTGAYPDILPNTALTWETTEQTDLGVDARFFGGKLTATFDWYIKDTKDWLVDAPALASYGTGSPTINGGAVRNSGVELALGWNHKIGDFFYSVNGNVAYNRNRVLYVDNADGIIHGSRNVISQNIDMYETFEARPGKPIGYFTGIASEGIFQNQEQIDAYKAKGYAFIDGYEKAQPGDVIWIDQNGDGNYNNEDIVEIGNPHPDVTMGLNITLEYKGIDLSLSGSGAFGQQVLQSYRSFASKDLDNYTNNFVNRLWTGEGSTNRFPRFSDGRHNNFFCGGYVGDIWVQDADYFKIRTITLGYDFKQAVKKLPMESLRLFFTGQNLFTFTKYDGMDPEVGYGPLGWTSGIDIGYYPSPKSYMIGLSVKF